MLTATRKKPKRKVTFLTPQYHGQRMSLEDFDRAETEAPGLFELSKGIIEVSDVPDLSHGRVVANVRQQLTLFEMANAGIIKYMSSGGEAKVLIESVESERHPDWLVYLTEAPNEAQPWSIWVPEIVLEVVSKSSAKRDYEEKPPEYLMLGVEEVWILDPLREILTVKTRWRGLWQDAVYKPSQKYRTRLLPGFVFDIRKALAAGKK